MALLLGVFVVAPIAAQFSAGIMVGEPSGLSAKLWVGELSAVDLMLAWSLADDAQRFYVHSDYQHYLAFMEVENGRLFAYVGIGGRLYVGDGATLGIRIPVGIYYELERLPIELFLEIAPGLNLLPETEVNVGGGIGGRYRF